MTSTTISGPAQNVLDRLPDARWNGRGWTARCPAHDDHRPSLSIAEGDDHRVLLHCHAGCPAEAVAKAIGLTLADLMPADRDRPPARTSRKVAADEGVGFNTLAEAVQAAAQSAGQTVAQWQYAEGFYTVRFERDGEKTFRPVSRGADGRWRLRFPPAPLPLYALDHLPQTGPVVVVEGERCADYARGLGLAAVTSAGGSAAAGKSDWRALAGREAIVLPDADEPGERYAASVADALARLDPPAQVRIVRLPDLPPGGDVVDFITANRERPPADLRAEIQTLAKAAPIYVPSRAGAVGRKTGPRVLSRRAADIAPERVAWLWPRRIPAGKLTILLGNPGQGKSLMALAVAAVVTRGAGWPDAPEFRADPADVLLASAEDDAADTIRPRAEAAGVDLARLHVIEGVVHPDGRHVLDVCTDLEPLRQLAKDTPGARLLILDPLAAFMPGPDSYKACEVRAALAPLAALAQKTGIAVLAVHHMRKSPGQAIHRGLGSIAFTAAARSVLGIGPDPSTPTSDRRMLVPVKCNLSVLPPTLAFCIKGDAKGVPVVEWEAEAIQGMDADTVLGGFTEGQSGPVPEARRAAETFLTEKLAGGPRPSEELIAEAKDAGIAERTLWRAKANLGITAGKDGFGGPWLWTRRVPGIPLT